LRCDEEIGRNLDGARAMKWGRVANGSYVGCEVLKRTGMAGGGRMVGEAATGWLFHADVAGYARAWGDGR